MKEYDIKFNTGAGDFTLAGTLEEAKAAADDGAAYTQQNIEIYEGASLVAHRPWIGIAFDPDVTEYTEDEVIQFGSFGHYGAWMDF